MIKDIMGFFCNTSGCYTWPIYVELCVMYVSVGAAMDADKQARCHREILAIMEEDIKR